MCCVVKLHVDMLTLFKKLLTKEQMTMQKVRKKMHFYLAYRVILILFMVLNPLLYFLQLISFVSYIMNCTNLYDFLQLFGSCIYKEGELINW